MTRLLLFSMIVLLTCGCLTKRGHGRDERHVLSADRAADLAAQIANEECGRLYNRRPFNGEDHVPELGEARWRWGHLDPAGHDGLSAEVTFDPYGANAEVTVYFSSDKLQRDRLQRTPPRTGESRPGGVIILPEPKVRNVDDK